MFYRLLKLLKLVLLLVASSIVLAQAAKSAGPSTITIKDLPSTKRCLLELYLYSAEVPGFLKALNGRYLFVDVRTPREIMDQGTPAQIDANVPIEFSNNFVIPWGSVNNDYKSDGTVGFAAKINVLLEKKGLGKNATIVLISNHGERSAMAANMLAWHGYDMVYSVVDGYEGDHVTERNVRNNGWVGNHLPKKMPNAPPAGESSFGSAR
jgi:rhodanese-related sulfurtransferase